MNNIICKICNQEVVNGHTWKEHRIKEADYFHQYEPRYSKQTNELIKFKNRDFYLSSDFNNKKEMIAWFKANPEQAKSYGLELLKSRMVKKKLVHAPSQVELRSLMMPSMIWYAKEFGSYTNACNIIGGSIPKFDEEDYSIRCSPLKENSVLLTDSREQNPLSFPVKTEVIGLPYGDYTLKPNRLKIYIERKSISDFAGTFGTNLERFKREVQRAKKDRAYLVVLVESRINDALHFNYLPQMKFSKVNPDFVFRNVRELTQEYNNLQFLFCDGRKEAADLILKILTMTKHPKHIDLQFYYDAKKM